MELASKNVADLKQCIGVDSQLVETSKQDVHKVQVESVRWQPQTARSQLAQPPSECQRCKGQHWASLCKCKDAECYKCKKR